MFSVMFICLSVHRVIPPYMVPVPLCTGPQPQPRFQPHPLLPRHVQTCSISTSLYRNPPPKDIFKLSIMKKSGRLVSYWSFLKRLRLYWKSLFFYLFELFSNTRGISIVRLRFLCLISLNVLLFPNLTENNFLCWFTFSKTNCFFLTIICA